MYEIKFRQVRDRLLGDTPPEVLIVNAESLEIVARMVEQPVKKPQTIGGKTRSFWQPGPLAVRIVAFLNGELDTSLTGEETEELKGALEYLRATNRRIAGNLAQVAGLLQAALAASAVQFDGNGTVSMIENQLLAIMEDMKSMAGGGDDAVE